MRRRGGHRSGVRRHRRRFVVSRYCGHDHGPKAWVDGEIARMIEDCFPVGDFVGREEERARLVDERRKQFGL